MNEENLVSPPPRDALILRRQVAVKSYEKRVAQNMADNHESLLEQFATCYFKGEARLDDLSQAEKKELAGIFFRRSIRNLFFTFSPYVTVLTILNFLSPKTILDYFFLNLCGILISGLCMGFTCMFQDLFDRIKINDYFNFMRAHLFLKKHGLPEEK